MRHILGYEHLREQYPEIISKDQLYRICRIRKRRVQWLPEDGVIPCEDSDKHTRRFHTRLEDVITFLEQRGAVRLSAGAAGRRSRYARHPINGLFVRLRAGSH